MNKTFVYLINAASFLVSFLYGFSFILPAYMSALGGNDFDVGIFLSVSGVSTILTVLFVRVIFSSLTALHVSAISALSFGVGIVLLGVTEKFGITILISALLMGFGWGAFYISGPIALSGSLNNENRSVYFGYLAAWNAMGAGLSPIFFKLLSSVGLSVHEALIAGFLPAILAFICFIFARKYAGHTSTLLDKEKEKLLAVIFNKDIFRSKAIYPIVMVLIGACLFSSMMNFQVSYARINNLNYSWYFFFYTLVVIASIFMLSKPLSRVIDFQKKNLTFVR